MRFRGAKRLLLIGALAAIPAAVMPGGSLAAGPPQVLSTAVEGVSATGATLRATINANGLSTTYRFEYLSEAEYIANLTAQPPRDPFQGAAIAPLTGAGSVGAGTTPIGVSQHPSGLLGDTAYRYRVRAANSAEVVYGAARPFGTEVPSNAFELLDGRGWEMVSPIAKNGGAIQAPGSIFGGGVFQAAAAGGSLTYSSVDSFGAEAQGAPAGSQYLAGLGGAGWATANVTTPLLSGSYGDSPDGVPYQLFSADLSRALLSNGERCRGDAGGECPVANPPLSGSGAPSGYRDYYRRNAAGGFESILTTAALSHTALGPAQFELRLVAATPDLGHVVLSTCAALTANASEVAAPGGCDQGAQNLYEWSGGALSLINVAPGGSAGAPGAAIGTGSGAVSANGSRVYFTTPAGVYLREGSITKPVVEAAGAEFAGGADDGSAAYVISGGALSRFVAASGSSAPLAASAVEGVLGVSADGSRAYYAQAGAVFLVNGAATTEIASSATPGNWPAATGTARISADGTHLLFLSDAELTGYPNEGQTEVFLYGPLPGGTVPILTCVSCNPTGERPLGPSSIPGARANGSGADAVDAYKPRVLAAGAGRVFFDSSDSLVAQDTNQRPDVYEWEAGGIGTCTRPVGCVELISSGRSGEASTFVDASSDGSDAFFLTSESLYPFDPGSYDIYDARIGGGFSVPVGVVPCEGDACQILPEAPEDPTPGTLTPNSGNPPLQIEGETKKKKSGKHKKKPGKHNKKKPGKHGKAKKKKPSGTGGRGGGR